VLFALDYRGLPLKLSLGDPDVMPPRRCRVLIGYLQALSNGIKANHEHGLHLPELRPARGIALRQPGPHSCREPCAG
jgi:hypothetical protein